MENSAISKGTKSNPCLVLPKSHANQLPEWDLICWSTKGNLIQSCEYLLRPYYEPSIELDHARVTDMKEDLGPQRVYDLHEHNYKAKCDKSLKQGMNIMQAGYHEFSGEKMSGHRESRRLLRGREVWDRLWTMTRVAQ